MDRRDFLLFRTEQRLRIVELSCERLYMRYLDAQATASLRAEPRDQDTWDGEPPAQLEAPTVRQLFADLQRELQGADVLRVVDSDWLASDDFRQEFETVMSAFRARAGRVEYSKTSTAPQHEG